MIFPSILPDELAVGYEGRLAHSNGIGTVIELRKSLLRRFQPGAKSLHEAQTPSLIAHAAGISLDALLRESSLLPYRRAVMRSNDETSHSLSHGSVWMLGMRVLRSKAYLCPDCTREDLDFHGLSYWRRTHQLPGFLWCPKHHTALSAVPIANGVWSAPSRAAVEDSCVQADFMQELHHSATLRFMTISEHLARTGASIEERVVSAAVQEWVEESGLALTHNYRRKRLLSDHIRDSFPMPWIAATFPGLLEKSERTFWNPIDRVYRGDKLIPCTSVYVAILSVMYQESDAALRLLDDLAGQSAWRNISANVARDATTSIHNEDPALLNQFRVTRQASAREALNIFCQENRSVADAARTTGISTIELESLIRDTLIQGAAPISSPSLTKIPEYVRNSALVH